MSITQEQTPIREVRCSNCGREIPIGRLFCPFCGHRIVRQQDVPNPKEQPAQSEEAQRLQASLQAAENENQKLQQQLRDQQEELSGAKNESDTHREALDSHRAILRTTQEKLAELEPQVLEWRQRWNLADQRVRAVESELAARAKDLESALSRTGQDVPDPKEQPAQSEEAQRLQASLQAEQTKNQNLQQQLGAQQSELNRAKSESDTHREALDSHRAILKTAQEKLAALEPQVSEWRQRWNLADQKVKAVETNLATKAKDLESALSRTAGSAQWSRRIKVIGGMLTLLGGLGGLGAGRYTKRDSTRTPNQLPIVLAKLSQAQKEVKDLTAKLNLAATRENGLKSQLDSANQKIDQFATNSDARDERERAAESKGALAKGDLQSVQAKLADAVAKQRSADQTMQKLVEQLNTSNQRNQQLEAQVKFLRAQPDGRPPNPSNLLKQDIGKGGILLWTGVLSGKHKIDIKDGHPNYGSVRGALPGTPCSVFISDPSHATLKTMPSQKNHWREVSFEVLGAESPQNIQVQITWILSQPHY
jgi:chromosome segregation ATPase